MGSSELANRGLVLTHVAVERLAAGVATREFAVQLAQLLAEFRALLLPARQLDADVVQLTLECLQRVELHRHLAADGGTTARRRNRSELVTRQNQKCSCQFSASCLNFYHI